MSQTIQLSDRELGCEKVVKKGLGVGRQQTLQGLLKAWVFPEGKEAHQPCKAHLSQDTVQSLWHLDERTAFPHFEVVNHVDGRRWHLLASHLLPKVWQERTDELSFTTRLELICS